MDEDLDRLEHALANLGIRYVTYTLAEDVVRDGLGLLGVRLELRRPS
jgi:hypothetical protein